MNTKEHIQGNAKVSGYAIVTGDAIIGGDAIILRDMEEAPGSREHAFLSHVRDTIKEFWSAYHGPDFADEKESRG